MSSNHEEKKKRSKSGDTVLFKQQLGIFGDSPFLHVEVPRMLKVFQVRVDKIVFMRYSTYLVRLG